MEEIRVAWEVSDKVVWWSADVIQIDDAASSKRQTHAVIRYRAQRKYSAEDHAVAFDAISNKKAKTVRHLDSESTAPAAWLFVDEPIIHPSQTKQSVGKGKQRTSTVQSEEGELDEEGTIYQQNEAKPPSPSQVGTVDNTLTTIADIQDRKTNSAEQLQTTPPLVPTHDSSTGSRKSHDNM